ncbi:WD40-repeat-containing domain protein [Lipomyces oligophaga]|uniref:WD40-repeat-containing domain protein n=1 Tax=Lipomyces oligophaga TaxID=45792 RepID=UPI0034CEFBD5
MDFVVNASTMPLGATKRSKIRRAKDIKLRNNLKQLDRRYKDARRAVKSSEYLLQEDIGGLEAEGMERTFKFTQEQIKQEVDISTAAKGFDLRLEDYGPYCVDYSRNGRKLLLGGKRGHIAAFDFREGSLDTELHVNEIVRDVKYLHNDTFFAIAQKKYVFIYDKSGAEIHCLKKHIEVTHMEFLPYHFLLATVGNAGWLKYQDTSTGDQVAELRTKLGPSSAMALNPWNAVVHLGHANGTVSLWSPSSSTPLVKMICHKGPVSSVAIHRGGNYMSTAGMDGQLKIWDIRNFREVHAYYTPTPATSLDISERGLISVGWGPHVTVWNDAFRTKQKSPYMTHLSPGSIVNDVKFCPFDDVLAFGHDNGVTSLIVPGSGEANFDTLEVNPYETLQQRRETEVQGLLNKLQPEMITLDPNFVGDLDTRAPEERQRMVNLETTGEQDLKKKEYEKKLEPRAKQRGRNSSLRRYLRKRTNNVIDDRRVRVQNALEKEKKMRQNLWKDEHGLPSDERKFGLALARFAK